MKEVVMERIPVGELSKEQRKEWEQFLENAVQEGLPSIYQTFAWVDFFEHVIPRGNIALYTLREKSSGTIVLGSMGYLYPLTGKLHWLYFSRGPMWSKDCSKEVLGAYFTFFLDRVKTILPHAVLIRFDPQVEEMLPEAEVFKKYAKAHKAFHPRKNLLLDLEKTEETLLGEMHPKGRYNIRYAEKKGVQICGWSWDGKMMIPLSMEGMLEGFSEQDPVGVFAGIIRETGARDGFAVHDRAYFEHFLKGLGKEHAFILLARFEGIWIAGGLFSHIGQTCTYYYGASSNAHRNVMAPYLVQWRAIQYAKKILHKRVYDFQGIAEEEGDELSGVAEFKRKFGGREVTYVGTFEVVLKPMFFALMKMAKGLRKIVKGR